MLPQCRFLSRGLERLHCKMTSKTFFSGAKLKDCSFFKFFTVVCWISEIVSVVAQNGLLIATGFPTTTQVTAYHRVGAFKSLSRINYKHRENLFQNGFEMMHPTKKELPFKTRQALSSMSSDGEAVDLIDDVYSLKYVKDSKIFNAALSAILGKEGIYQKSNVEKAQAFFESIAVEAPDKMIDTALPHNISHIVNVDSFMLLIEAWVKCEEPERAHDLLERMKKMYPVRLNTFVCNVVLKGWAQASGSRKYPQACEEAEKIVEWMENQYLEANRKGIPCNCQPDTITYNTLMNAVSRGPGGLSVAKRTEEILRKMLVSKNSHVKVDDISFGTVLGAYARSGGRTLAANQAERLLEEMEALYKLGNKGLSPTTYCVNLVLNAWSQAASRTKGKEAANAAQRAYDVLMRMELLHRKGRTLLKPNIVSYNTVLSAFARSDTKGAADRAEELLRRMGESVTGDARESSSLLNGSNAVQPDLISFNSVIHAWSRSRYKWAAQRAENILNYMEELHKKGRTPKPDVTSYSIVIHAWAKSASAHMHKSEGISSAQKAENIIHRMTKLYNSGSNVNAKPNVLAYNSVLNAWSKSGEDGAAERANSILTKMEEDPDMMPDVFSYTSVIDAFAKAKNAKMSLNTLERMEKLYNSTGITAVKPNVKSYTSVINAFGRSGGEVRGDVEINDPEQANIILCRMEKLYHSGEQPDLKPDQVAYNAVINAFAWSPVIVNKAERTHQIFNRMRELHRTGKNLDAKPDMTTCNSILKACAYTNDQHEKAKALQIAISTYQTFLDASPEYGTPDDSTFGNMILAITNLIPVTFKENDDMNQERIKLSETVWQDCCKNGYASAYVLAKLQIALSNVPNVYFKLTGAPLTQNEERNQFKYSSQEDVDALPHDWRRNIITFPRKQKEMITAKK